MKIKYKITLLFTLLVTAILLLLCISIYYFSERNRQFEFRKRLRNRALTTISLLRKVPGINQDLMKKIDESTLIALQQKSVMVYGQDKNLYYEYADEKTDPVSVNDFLLTKIKKTGEYYFTEKGKDAVILSYSDTKNSYIVVAAAYDKDGFDKNEQLLLILLLSFTSGILITFLSGFFFSKRIVIPIQKITNEVKEISSQNLSRRIETHETKDELNDLASTFNELMNRLQESFEIQRRFIANASHELSTPLTAVLNQLEITLQKERNLTEYLEVINSVHDDVINLSQLTKNLLEIAKASGSFAGIDFSLHRIDELLMKLPAVAYKMDPKYLVKLHFDIFPDDEDKLLIFVNPDLLFSAIKNIVLNACKYSEDHIALVSLHFLEDSIEIKVCDNGHGIKEQEMPFVFQPFYRGSNSGAKQGFGLGLSLAYEILHIHKGSVVLKNLPEKGSEFKISLPVASSFMIKNSN